tara:strand:+ start:92 stop:661 length:570 start_codon:yes stop_codon:yes gene_type:complete
MKLEKKNFNILLNINNNNLLSKVLFSSKKNKNIKKKFFISKKKKFEKKNVVFKNEEFFLKELKNEDLILPLDEKFVNYFNKYEHQILSNLYKNSKSSENFIYEDERRNLFIMIKNIKYFILKNKINLIIFEGTKIEFLQSLIFLVANFFYIKIFFLRKNKYIFNNNYEDSNNFSHLIKKVEILNPTKKL